MELTCSDERRVALLTRARCKSISLKVDWMPSKETAARQGPLSIVEIDIP